MFGFMSAKATCVFRGRRFAALTYDHQTFPDGSRRNGLAAVKKKNPTTTAN